MSAQDIQTDCRAVTRLEIVDHVEAAFADAPLGRQDLLHAVVAAGARPQVVEVLRRLPERHHYSHPRELWQHLREVPVEQLVVDGAERAALRVVLRAHPLRLRTLDRGRVA